MSATVQRVEAITTQQSKTLIKNMVKNKEVTLQVYILTNETFLLDESFCFVHMLSS